MNPVDTKVTSLAQFRQARMMDRAVSEYSKTPTGKIFELMSIDACQDPKKLKECMAEVCNRANRAPDYQRWPGEETGDMRLWFNAFAAGEPNTGFEKAFYFWIHRDDFCMKFRWTPFGALDAGEEADVEAAAKDTLKRSAIIALTGKLVWDAIGAMAPAVDFALARFLPIFIPRYDFEPPQDPYL